MPEKQTGRRLRIGSSGLFGSRVAVPPASKMPIMLWLSLRWHFGLQHEVATHELLQLVVDLRLSCPIRLEARSGSDGLCQHIFASQFSLSAGSLERGVEGLSESG